MASKMEGFKPERSKTWQYLFIGLLILAGGFIMYAIFIKPKTQTTTNANGIATDQNGQPVGYIPTTTSFTNLNISEGNTTTNTSTVTTNDPMTGSNNTGGTTIINPPPLPISGGHPVTSPPPPTQPVGAPPQQPHYQTYVVKPGDTLSGIAGHYGTTWQALFNINQSTITSWANRHGNPIAGGPQNNIFVGEPILVPA